MKNVYIIGICGTAMASLAGLLKSKGYDVFGSDSNSYPPMSDMLRSQGIEVLKGYSKKNLEGLAQKIDFAIIGNVIRSDNEEARFIIDSGVEYFSMPSFLKRFILPSYKTLVVAGTHGKSSTASMLASVLTTLGENPSFLIGAVPINFGVSYRLSEGEYFVIEGDEYDTAFFDKSPKFMHYLPFSAIITSIEFDHADIYGNFDIYKEQFVRFSEIVDKGGCLVMKDDNVIKETIRRNDIKKVYYGDKSDSDSYILDTLYRDGFMFVCAVLNGERIEYKLRVLGYQNALNSLSVITLLTSLGFDRSDVIRAIEDFKGVKRRMEFLGDFSGVGIIDDFAHHPTAVRVTIDATKRAFVDTNRYKRLIAIFEPRSNTTRRNIFFEEYSKAFVGSDIVIMSKPYKKHDNLKDELDVKGILQNLSKYGIKGFCGEDVQDMLRLISENARQRDLLLFMSNGDFGGLVNKTINLLKGEV
ncbi:MAG: Mur ligase family protein [Deltaproteobacteria bacterium]|nr:Mur ligase family protein [Deltaproteobacteria bacterium]